MAFGDEARKAQGLFRNASATISSAGKTPADPKGIRNSHLLALGFEKENLCPEIRGDSQALRFFAERGIKWWKSSRSGDDFSRPGPTRNMASSQIFCLNFWYPIKEDREFLTAILKSIEPAVQDVVSIQSKSACNGTELSSLAEFEWVGSSTTLEKKRYSRGANATSIDAFVAGKSKNERIGFFFEWKMVEEYRGTDLGIGSSGITRRYNYQEYMNDANRKFSNKIPIDAILYEPFYQIFRMGLLGQKMIYQDKELDRVYVIPVYPRNNSDYSNRITSPWLEKNFGSHATVSEIASQFFEAPIIFKSIYADELWSNTRKCSRLSAHKTWEQYMNSRYFENEI